MSRTTVSRAKEKQNFVAEIPVRVIKYAEPGTTAIAKSSCAATIDTEITRLEDSSLKITPSDNSYAAYALYYAEGIDLNNPNGLALSFYVDNVSLQAGGEPYMTINYSNDATGPGTPVNRRSHSIYFSGVRNGWQYIRLRDDDAAAAPYEGPTGLGWTNWGTGATLTSPVKWVRLEFYKFAERNIYIEGLYRGGATRSKFVWMFDAWHAYNRINVMNIFTANNWTLSLDVPDNYLRDDPVTMAQYELALAAGAEPVLNDIQNRNIQYLAAEEVVDLIKANRELFNQRGWNYNPELFIYNNNRYSDATIQGLKSAGIKYARGGINEMIYTQHEQGMANPLRAASRTMDNQVFSTLKKWIDRIVQYQTTAVWYQHNLVPGGTVGGSSSGPGGLNMYLEDFLAFAAYVKNLEDQGLIEVLGLSEWWNGLTNAHKSISSTRETIVHPFSEPIYDIPQNELVEWYDFSVNTPNTQAWASKTEYDLQCWRGSSLAADSTTDPTLGITGATFNGASTGQYMIPGTIFNAIAGASCVTVLYILKPLALKTGTNKDMLSDRICSGTSTSGMAEWFTDSGKLICGARALPSDVFGNCSLTSATAIGIVGNWMLLAIEYDVTAKTITIFKNGIATGDKKINAAFGRNTFWAELVSSRNDHFGINAILTAGRYANMTLLETMVYKRALTLAEHVAIATYAKNKLITLGVNNPW